MCLSIDPPFSQGCTPNDTYILWIVTQWHLFCSLLHWMTLSLTTIWTKFEISAHILTPILKKIWAFQHKRGKNNTLIRFPNVIDPSFKPPLVIYCQFSRNWSHAWSHQDPSVSLHGAKFRKDKQLPNSNRKIYMNLLQTHIISFKRNWTRSRNQGSQCHWPSLKDACNPLSILSKLVTCLVSSGPKCVSAWSIWLIYKHKQANNWQEDSPKIHR